MPIRASLFGLLTAVCLAVVFTPSAAVPAGDEPAKVSYYKDVRPIFQQPSNGCHQPAKPQGGYVMTDHADLLKAGEQGKVGVVPGKPAASHVIEQITPKEKGKAEMPKNRDPLTSAQIRLITDW